MNCPFLRDARVKFCEAMPYRKLFDASNRTDAERCYSTAYTGCPAATSRLAGKPTAARCPLLHESDAQFCAAASLMKYIPATNAQLSRCNSDDHHYCELYLGHADPAGRRRPRAAGSDVSVVDGLPVPSHLSYAPNHMWADIADDGRCHVGVDAFFAAAAGEVEKVAFVTPRGVGAPAAILTVNGVDLKLEFPNALQNCLPNAYLRTAPQRVTSDPYGAGWLFEGMDPTVPWDTPGEAVRAGLMSSAAAKSWMREEAARLTGFVHAQIARAQDGSASLPDGGVAAAGVALHLDRDAVIDLYEQFFAMKGRRS